MATWWSCESDRLVLMKLLERSQIPAQFCSMVKDATRMKADNEATYTFQSFHIKLYPHEMGPTLLFSNLEDQNMDEDMK